MKDSDIAKHNRLENVSYCKVLITTSDNEVVKGYYANGSFYDYYTELDGVKAWMDIPRSYVEDKSK